MGQRWVSVLEVSDRNEPVVDPQIWEEIPDRHIRKSELPAQDRKDTDCDGETDVAQEDELRILHLVKWTGWIEVIDTIVASHIGEKVHGPPE